MRPSQSNRLLDYVKITERDGMIAEYVDYIKFYGKYRSKAKVFFSRDNGESLNLRNFRLTKSRNKQFIVDVFYYYCGYDLHLCSFTENYVNGKSVMSCDLYGKGLLVLNREDLREDLSFVFQFFGYHDVVLTRIDYAVDTQVVNWKKPCSLKAKYTDVKKERGVPYYVTFGQKLTSPLFIRYYEKIKDLVENETLWLYPEYKQYDKVMRYELQINSAGIDKDHKEYKIDEIKNLANFGHYVPKNSRNHHKQVFETEELKKIKAILKSMRKRGDWHSLVSINRLSHDLLLNCGPIVEDEGVKRVRESLEIKKLKQDEKIYEKFLKSFEDLEKEI